MNKLILVFLIVAFVTSCATYRRVELVTEEPVGCEYLGEVSEWETSCTSAHITNLLKKEAHRVKANTILCCWAGEALIAQAKNTRTGKPCVVGAQIYAKAYVCERKR